VTCWVSLLVCTTTRKAEEYCRGRAVSRLTRDVMGGRAGWKHGRQKLRRWRGKAAER
jgi:hypothetical protein